MKTRKSILCGILAAILAFALAFIACDDGKGSGSDDEVAPEDLPVADRWESWVDDSSTATITHSVAADGVCTITVGGTVETTSNNRWKATAQYAYTANANTRYIYKFEAWTQSGDRYLNWQYYNTWDEDGTVLSVLGLKIDSTRKTYTIIGERIPKDGVRQLEFMGADQLGTFYVKMLSIEVFETGTLTITNFSGNPGLPENSWVGGVAYINSRNLTFGLNPRSSGDANSYDYAQVTGSSITLDVLLFESDNRGYTIAPYTGNDSVAAGDLQFTRNNYDYYKNKVPITFTNGNATIDFGAQMEVWY